MVDLEAKPKIEEGFPRKKLIALLRFLILALWVLSFSILMAALWLGDPPKVLPSLGDVATLLFGASSIALILFSLLIGGGAVVGYQALREGIRKDIEAETRQRINAVAKEAEGRVLSAIGLLLGELATPNKLGQDNPSNYLAESVLHCQQAYKILKDMEGNVKYTALNNLVYYSCLLAEIQVGDRLWEEELLKNARVLREIGPGKNFAEALLTYCRAILQFGSSAQEIADAHSVANSLLLRKDVTDRQRKEATIYVTSLAKKLPTGSAGIQRL